MILVSGQMLRFKGRTFPCAVGRAGIGEKRGEGDNITPTGQFPLRRVFYRADRIAEPETALDTHVIKPDDGWCDDPECAEYNRPVKLPFFGSHEIMWREDGLYDVVVELGFNDAPPVPGKGSCIFLHVWRGSGEATAGCVALARENLLEVLKEADADTYIRIESSANI